MRQTFAEINLSNLKKNFLQLKKAAKSAGIMAVVKADAYGHGVSECIKALESLGDSAPDYYGVALLEEAVELRKIFRRRIPILVFAPLGPGESDIYIKLGITCTIVSGSQIDMIKGSALGGRLKFHIKVDTGMGRLGVHYSQALRLIQELKGIKNTVLEGIYTHFASADTDENFTLLQLGRFRKVLGEVKKMGISFSYAHAANSAAIIRYRESHLDMVRPGISLYGYTPARWMSGLINLKPVLSLISEADSFKKIEKGESVSYGRIFTARRETGIVTLPIGYADGLNRNLSGRIRVVGMNKYYNQVGRVTMDRIMIDVGKDKVKLGERFYLLGGKNKKRIDAWDWAELLNTIPYEITCGISGRVPRIFV